MNKCRNLQHPHCTHWVLPDADVCAGGHAQPAASGQPLEPAALSMTADAATQGQQPGLAAIPAPGGPAAQVPLTGFDLTATCGTGAPMQPERRAGAAMPHERRGQTPAQAHPTLHVSGFDPRAAGGRQALRLELRSMPADVPSRLTLQLKSALMSPGSTHRDFTRTRHGEWPPAIIEFSSRGREHGQYPIEVELLAHRDGAPPRRWTCTVVVLVPRPDATLTDIHQTFLATHKNVRIMADDASIARLGASTGGGRLDIDLTARNASIAQLNLDASGKADLALSSIAWDEELIETGMAARAHPQPTQSACLVNAAPAPGEVRHIRLFALDECVLGRLDAAAPIADVLLAHYGERGPDGAGPTRRLSAQHAILRCGPRGFELEDISRYGLLLDGAWPGKYVPVALRPGMRIELTASVRSIVTLEVTAVLAHGIALHRIDAGQPAECFCFVAPGRRPAPVPSDITPRAAALSVLYHANGGFWHLDRATGRDTPLCDGTHSDRLPGLPPHSRFTATPYPDLALELPARRPHAQLPHRPHALASA